jgi:hypothetical protein
MLSVREAAQSSGDACQLHPGQGLLCAVGESLHLGMHIIVCDPKQRSSLQLTALKARNKVSESDLAKALFGKSQLQVFMRTSPIKQS